MMMKKRKIGSALLLILTFCMIFGTSLVRSSNAEASASGGGVTMSVTYGFYNQARYGRCFDLYVSLTSHNEDFSGVLTAVFQTGETDTLEYEAEVAAVAGLRNTYSIPVAAYTKMDSIHVMLADTSGKTAVECTITPDILNYGRNLLVGVLSEKAEEYQYLEYLGAKVINLDKEFLPPDVYGYDMLDMVVIDQFDSEELDPADREVLKEWVRRGGTLVFGSGERELSAYQGFEEEFGEILAVDSYEADVDFGLSGSGSEKEKISAVIASYEEMRKNQIVGMNSMLNYTVKYIGNSGMYEQSVQQESDLLEDDNGEVQIKYGNYIAASVLKGKKLEDFRTVPLERIILEIQSDGYTKVSGNGQNPPLYRKQTGEGTVLVSGIALSVGKEEEDDENLVLFALSDSIRKYIDESRITKVQQENYGTGGVDYRLLNAVNLVDESKVPKIGKYAAVLSVYVLLAGPALFLLLRKRDKSLHIWWILPATAFLVTLLIYAMGSKTRIKEPYVSYVDMLQYDESGDAQGTIYFSVTSPSSSREKVALASLDALVELRQGAFPNYYTAQEMSMNNSRQYPNTQSYNNRIVDSESGSELLLDMYPAFTKAHYMSQYTVTDQSDLLEGTKIGNNGNEGSAGSNGAAGTDAADGSNETKETVRLTKDGLSGAVRNNTKYALNDVMVVGEQFLYYLGDMESGEEKALSGSTGVFVMTRDLLERNEILDSLSESKEKRPSNQAVRKSQVLRYFLENHIYNDGQSWMVGFTSEAAVNNPIRDYLSEEGQTGMTFVAVPIDVDGRIGGAEFVSDMDQYMNVVKGNYDDSYHYRFISSEELVVDYEFPDTEKITAILYTEARNLEYIEEYSAGYKGDVYFFNRLTGQYDMIFPDNVPGRVDDLSDFLDGSNTLRVKFVTGNTAYSSTYMTLPYLSYEKEAR